MSLIRFGPFSLDPAMRRLAREGVEVALQPKVFDTLVYLARNPGRAIAKAELLSELWPDAVVGDAALTRCVKELRKALGDDTRAPRYVKTLPRVGYRFVAELREAATGPSANATLAVLPFTPLAAGSSDESLELGMAETLITQLSGLRGLIVRSLTTVRQQETEQDPIAAGRRLGVEAVVEGSLQRAEDRLRVHVRVLRVADGRALVAERFDEPLGNVFSLQDTICSRIAAAVAGEFAGNEATRPSKQHTRNPDAYRHYLMGRLVLGPFTADSAERSIEHFERALEEDPQYAEALASIAEAWIIRANTGHHTKKCFAQVRGAAEAALAIDSGLGGAWACLAELAWKYDWQWEEADRRYQRALELAPGILDIYVGYSNFCAFNGRRDDAETLARQAVELDPGSASAGSILTQALYMAGRTDEAIAQGQATLAQAPAYPFAMFMMGLAAHANERWEEAIDWLQQACAAGRPDFLGVLGSAYVLAGRDADAANLETLISDAIASGVAPPLALAPIYAARGDARRLFEAFEHAYQARNWLVLLVPFEPLLDRYREDPRAVDLIARLGLEPGPSSPKGLGTITA